MSAVAVVRSGSAASAAAVLRVPADLRVPAVPVPVGFRGEVRQLRPGEVLEAALKP